MKIEIYNDMNVTFDIDRGMINATQMAKVNNKTTKDWLRTKSAKTFLNALSEARHICLGQLVDSQMGKHTMMHREAALEFARWLNPKFAIWCNDKIQELFDKGYTGLTDDITAKLDSIVEQNMSLQKQVLDLVQEQSRLATNSRSLTYEVSLQSELSYLMNLAGIKHSIEYPIKMGRLDIVLKRRAPYITVFELKNYSHELSGYDIDAHLFSSPIVEKSNSSRNRGYLRKLCRMGYTNIKFHFVVHREPSKYAYLALEKAMAHVKKSGYNIDIKISRLSEVVAYYWRLVQKKHGTRCNDHLNSMPKLKGIIESLPEL